LFKVNGTEEELDMGTYIHFLNTLGIRWGYAGHTTIIR